MDSVRFQRVSHFQREQGHSHSHSFLYSLLFQPIGSETSQPVAGTPTLYLTTSLPSGAEWSETRMTSCPYLFFSIHLEPRQPASSWDLPLLFTYSFPKWSAAERLPQGEERLLSLLILFQAERSGAAGASLLFTYSFTTSPREGEEYPSTY